MIKLITKVLKKSMLLLILVTIGINYSNAENLNRINTNDFLTITKLSKDLEQEMYNSKIARTQSMDNRIDFTINSKNLTQAFYGKTSVYLENFPIGKGQVGNLRLYYSKPAYDKNTKISLLYKGKAIDYKLPEFMTFYGTIDGDSESDVYLNVSETGISGLIQNGNGNIYNIGQNLVLESKVASLHTMIPTSTEESMHLNGVTNYCGASDKQNFDSFGKDDYNPNEVPKVDKNGNLQATSILEAHLALECDYVYFFKFKKNRQDVTLEDEADNQQAIAAGITYMNEVVTMGTRIYQREVNVTFVIDTIVFNADPSYDGYYDIRTKDLSDKLGRMPQVWAQRSNISRTLVTLFSDVRSQPSNATVLGIAMSGSPYTGALCSKDIGYSAVGITANGNYPTFNYSQDLQVFVHEVGHNFSSPHTHNCHYQPNLDTCVTQATEPDLAKDACQASGKKPKMDGDIMSYCHIGGSIVYKFHPEVKKRIRGAADKKKTSCMPVPAKPTVQLTYPIGSETLFANQVAQIGWNVEKVNRIKLSYSLNGGGDWIEIVGDKSAVNDSTHSWSVPDVSSNNALIKIEEVGNNTVVDQSILPFKIVQKSITIQSPVDGQEVGYSIPYNIRWSKSTVNLVKIQFSTNNGSSWTDLKNNLNTLNEEYDFPDVVNDNAKIRIIDTENGSVFDEVTFKLGKETAEIFSPKTGHFVCTPKPDFTYYYEQHYVDKLNIWFSNDGKVKWVKATFQPIDGNTSLFEWKGASNTNNLIVTDKAYVKFTPFGNDNLIIAEEGPFIVYECPLTVKDGVFNEEVLNISSISPNPVSDKSILNFYIDTKNYSHNLSLEVFDITGNVLLNSDLNTFNNGNNTLDLNLGNLSQGAYFVVLTYGEFKALQLVNVVK